MTSFLKEELKRSDPEEDKSRVLTFRYYLIIMTGLFLVGGIVDLFVDFKTISFSIFMVLASVPLTFLGLSWLNVPHKLLLYINMAALLAINEFQILNNPMAFHVLVFWIGLSPLLGAVLMNIRETVLWTFIVAAFIVVNGLYVSNVVPSYTLTLYPFRFMVAGLLFTFMVSVVTMLFSFAKYLTHKRLENQHDRLLSLTKEIEVQNTRLTEQHEEIASINSKLGEYNQHLEERVLERTEELEARNREMTEYAFINSHLLRGPLSRILGLLHLLNHSELTSKEKEILSHLNDAGTELDEVISKINKAIDSGHTFDRETIKKLNK